MFPNRLKFCFLNYFSLFKNCVQISSDLEFFWKSHNFRILVMTQKIKKVQFWFTYLCNTFQNFRTVDKHKIVLLNSLLCVHFNIFAYNLIRSHNIDEFYLTGLVFL